MNLVGGILPMSNVHKLYEWTEHAAEDDEAAPHARQEPLNAHGGGGTLPPMDVVDAKIQASEARTDTKFAELRGDLKNFATKSTVWQGVAVIIATLLAAMAFGGDRFDAGIGQADIRQAQLERDKKQDESVSRIEQKLDKLIAAQPKPK